MFIEPMYAAPLPNLAKNPKAKPFILEPGQWEAEEKYDGIRVTTEINSKPDRLFVEKGIRSWSRLGNPKPHPEHILEVLLKFPDCHIDGERFAPGLRSYGSMDLDNIPNLVYVIFDILQYKDHDLTNLSREIRREILHKIFQDYVSIDNDAVQFAPSLPVNTWEEVLEARDKVWARDGEGLILKKFDSVYIPGKRPKNTWIKIKKLQSAVFTVIGFIASRGEINNRGVFAMVQLRDEDGNITAVKTKNNFELEMFSKRAHGHYDLKGRLFNHPDIGRLLRCEYQERTPDGSYRHIRWDRWEDE